MRLFVSGDEEICRLHLPIAQAKVREFAVRCEKAGLKQNTYTFLFEDTGVSVRAQYAFGQLAMQLHAPTFVSEEETEEEDVLTACPKTFFIETVNGYFWVEVGRNDDGDAVVTLTPFTAKVRSEEDPSIEEFVYPAMGSQTAGMCAGVLDDQRYVVTQKAALFDGVCQEKGTIRLPATSESGRLTVVDAANEYQHDYLVVSGNHSARSIHRLTVTKPQDAPSVDVQMTYAEVDTLLAATSGALNQMMLQPNPAWIHRKCFGSYFSPQKTIGFHVDIGSDDSFMGNMDAIPPGLNDKLVPEFNHCADLYKFVAPLQFPVSVTGNKVTILAVSPTMLFQTDNEAVDKCWGGHGWDIDETGCADYGRDFAQWMLAPRLITIEVDLSSQSMAFSDGLPSDPVIVPTWDGDFHGQLICQQEYSCANDYVYEPGAEEKDKCDWSEEITFECAGTPYTATRIFERIVQQHKLEYAREDMENRKLLYFMFGPQSPTRNTYNNAGYYHLFEGLWHLDVGVLWGDSLISGNRCTLCSNPNTGQEPGELVYFYTNDTSAWVAANAHEYVENLEIVAPFGWHDMNGVTVLGFIARVPEEYAAPHEPVMLTGGIEYPDETVEGETVRCEKQIMSQPCICEGNLFYFDNYNNFRLGTLEQIIVHDGCPPYEWHIANGSLQNDEEGTIEYGSTVITPSTTMFVNVSECGDTLTVTDACGQLLEVSADIVVASIDGPDVLAPGETGVFSLDIGSSAVEYTGDLEFVSQAGNSFELRMPADACGGEYLVTLSGCGITGTLKLRPTDGQWVIIYSGPGDDWPVTPMEGDVAYGELGGYIYGEATSGKYKYRDFYQVAGGASVGLGSEYMDAGCPGHPALSTPFCVSITEVRVLFAATFTTPECFPTVLTGPIWNGNYLVYNPVTGITRTVWEWQC